MNNAMLPTSDVATHLKIIAIALAATMVVALVGIDAQTRSEGPEVLLQTTGHAVTPRN